MILLNLVYSVPFGSMSICVASLIENAYPFLPGQVLARGDEKGNYYKYAFHRYYSIQMFKEIAGRHFRPSFMNNQTLPSPPPFSEEYSP